MRLVLLCSLLPLVLLTGCMSTSAPPTKTAMEYYRDGEEKFALGITGKRSNPSKRFARCMNRPISTCRLR